MLKNIFFLLAVVSCMTACNSISKKFLGTGGGSGYNELPIDIPPAPRPPTGPQQMCFQMDVGGSPNEISKLTFTLFDNDSVKGWLQYATPLGQTIQGNISGLKEGKYLAIKYTYSDSNRVKHEVIPLKLEGDKLYKKNGAKIEQNGIWILENPLKARFELFMLQTSCK